MHASFVVVVIMSVCVCVCVCIAEANRNSTGALPFLDLQWSETPTAYTDHTS